MQLVCEKNYHLHSVRCMALPASKNGNTTFRRTHTGEAARCHIATVIYHETVFTIIEIDTESFKSKKSISSLVIVLDDKKEESLIEILKACSDKGVIWDFIKNRHHSIIFDTCRHPPREITRAAENKIITTRRTDEQFQNAWVSVFHLKIDKCFQRLQKEK